VYLQDEDANVYALALATGKLKWEYPVNIPEKSGPGPDGVAVMRFRPAIWSDALECYLAELYVRPAARGKGLGRALLAGAIDHARSRGASHMDLGTAESDEAARKLYESFGFSNREGKPDGSINYYYEREL